MSSSLNRIYLIKYLQESSTFTLQIKDIQETDVGTYTCQVSTSLHNRVTAHVQLIVRRPPLISDNSTRSVIVSENQRKFFRGVNLG